MDTITVYTDGSAIPNPGIAGYGFHFTYNNQVYDGFGPVGVTHTNNAAEILAVTQAILYIVDSLPNVKSINVFTDSRYVINGFEKLDIYEKANWTEKPNLELLIALKAARDKFSGIITLTWIKGHSGIRENIAADKNADKGRIALSGGCLDHVVDITDKVLELDIEISKNPPKKIVQVPALSSLFSGKRWFFHTNSSTVIDDMNVYCTSTYLEAAKHTKNVGKRSPNTHYAIVLSKTPIDVLDSLREKYNASLPDKNVPVIADLTTILKKAIWSELYVSKNKYTEIKGRLAVHIDSTVLAEINLPPKLTYKLEDIFKYGLRIIDVYQSNKEDATIIDITPYIYDVSAKGKYSMVTSFSSLLKMLTIPINLNDGMVQVKLVLGLDIPPRTNFNTLIKNTKNIKVLLMISDITESSYRVATIVVADADTGVYYSPDANYRIINKQTG